MATDETRMKPGWGTSEMAEGRRRGIFAAPKPQRKCKLRRSDIRMAFRKDYPNGIKSFSPELTAQRATLG